MPNQYFSTIVHHSVGNQNIIHKEYAWQAQRDTHGGMISSSLTICKQYHLVAIAMPVANYVYV